MRFRSFALAAITVLLATTGADAAWYGVDASHSRVGFKVKHYGISTVTGSFDRYNASFDFDPDTEKLGSVIATIEAASINTGTSGRDDHLRSPDFFGVEKDSTIVFKSTEIAPLKDGKTTIKGDLTIRGVTRPVVLEAEYGGAITDPRGNSRVAFSARGMINRKDFGVNWSKVMDNGGLVVSDEVQLVIEVEGIKQKSEGIVTPVQDATR